MQYMVCLLFFKKKTFTQIILILALCFLSRVLMNDLATVSLKLPMGQRRAVVFFKIRVI